MRYLFGTAAVLLALAGLSGCYSDNKEELYQNFPNSDCDTANTKFAADIQPIIVDNCATAGCHSGSTPQSGLDLSAYNDLKVIADDARLRGRITGDSGPIMPPSGAMDDCSLDRILKWVDEGAQNN